MFTELSNMNKLLKFFLILLIFGTKWSNVNSQLQVGDPCIVQTTRKLGTCVLLPNCSSALLLQRQGKRPTVCGYQNQVKIVCCQNLFFPNLETISHKKCVEYAYTEFEVIQRAMPNGTIYNISSGRCGHNAIPLIAGGAQALPKEFPYSAQLGYQISNGSVTWKCGGALISERYVLTEAYCLETNTFGNVKFVKLGDLNTGTDLDDAAPETYVAAEFIPHPYYNNRINYNNIALIKLDREVIFNNYIRPICLPVVNKPTNKSLIKTGWGRTEWHSDSTTLLKVVFRLFSHSECNSSYGTHRRLPQGIIDQTQICAGPTIASIDACDGFVGAPLQTDHDTIKCMYTLVGLASFGPPCRAANISEVFTRVAAYVDWIEEVVWSKDILFNLPEGFNLFLIK